MIVVRIVVLLVALAGCQVVFDVEPLPSITRTSIVQVNTPATTMVSFVRPVEIRDGDVLVFVLGVGDPRDNVVVSTPPDAVAVFDNLNNSGICGPGQQRRTLAYSSIARPEDGQYDFMFMDASVQNAVLVAYSGSQPPFTKDARGISNKDGTEPLLMPLPAYTLSPRSISLVTIHSSMTLSAIPEPMTNISTVGGIKTFELATPTGEVPERSLTIPTGACANYLELTFEPLE